MRSTPRGSAATRLPAIAAVEQQLSDAGKIARCHAQARCRKCLAGAVGEPVGRPDAERSNSAARA